MQQALVTGRAEAADAGRPKVWHLYAEA